MMELTGGMKPCTFYMSNDGIASPGYNESTAPGGDNPDESEVPRVQTGISHTVPPPSAIAHS